MFPRVLNGIRRLRANFICEPVTGGDEVRADRALNVHSAFTDD